jgi:hypothetical protein
LRLINCESCQLRSSDLGGQINPYRLVQARALANFGGRFSWHVGIFIVQNGQMRSFYARFSLQEISPAYKSRLENSAGPAKLAFGLRCGAARFCLVFDRFCLENLGGEYML